MSLRAGEFARAESHFIRAHHWAPRIPEVCYALGRERLRSGKIDEAEELLRTAWEGDPSLIGASATLARCLAIYQRRFAEAHTVLDQAEAAGTNAMLAVVRSEVHIEEGRTAEAAIAAETALACCDSDASAGRESASTREAARAALARVHNQRGIDLLSCDQADCALFAFKRAGDLDPRWSSPRVNMGAAFVDMGKCERALVAFEAAIAADPDDPEAHYHLGVNLLDRGDLARARAALEVAVDLDPDPVEARTALAQTYLSLGDVAPALTLLAKIADEVPTDANSWVNLGAALCANEDREGAEPAFRRALEIDPQHIGACCRLADLLTRDARYLEAAVLAERAQHTDPEAAEAHFSGRTRPRRTP